MTMYYYFILSVLFGLFFYTVGHLLNLFWLSKKEYTDYEKFFLKTVCGLLAVIVIYASLKTKGNTVLSGITLMSLFYLYFNKDRLSSFNYSNLLKIEKSPLVLFTGISIIFSALLYYLIFPDLISIHNDFFYFAAIADYLNLHGIETNTLNIVKETAKPNLYHYFNEWASAFISAPTNEVGLVSLVYIYFPLIISILFVGLVCLVQKFSKRDIVRATLFAFLFFILSPILGGGGVPALFSFYGFEVSIGSYFATPVIKFAVVVVLLIYTLIVYERERFIDVIYLFLIIAYVWPVTTIAIFGGVFLFIVYNKLVKNEFVINEFVIWLLGTCYIGLFYVFQSSDVQLSAGSQSSYLDKLLDYLKNDFNPLLHIKYFLGTIITRFYYYGLFLLIIILNWRLLRTHLGSLRNYNVYILLYVLIAFCGLLGKSILFFMTDSNQVFENIFDHTFMYLVTFTLLILVSKNKFNYIFIVFFLASSMITYYKQSDHLKNKSVDLLVLKSLEKEFAGKSYTFASSVKASNSSFGHISQIVYPPLTFLRAYTNSYFPMNISLYDRYQSQFLKEKDYSKKIRYESLMTSYPFYFFVKTNDYLHEDWRTKYLFLKEQKIDYLVLEKGSLESDFFSSLKVIKRIDLPTLNTEIVKLKWE